MQGDRFSLPWRERVRVRGQKIKAPSPLSSPVKGEDASNITFSALDTPPLAAGSSFLNLLLIHIIGGARLNCGTADKRAARHSMPGALVQ